METKNITLSQSEGFLVAVACKLFYEGNKTQADILETNEEDVKHILELSTGYKMIFDKVLEQLDDEAKEIVFKVLNDVEDDVNSAVKLYMKVKEEG